MYRRQEQLACKGIILDRRYQPVLLVLFASVLVEEGDCLDNRQDLLRHAPAPWFVVRNPTHECLPVRDYYPVRLQGLLEGVMPLDDCFRGGFFIVGVVL